MLSWSPATTLITTTVDMHGFTPSSSHAMHIHPGTCADQTQPPSVPFPDISAGAEGAVQMVHQRRVRVGADAVAEDEAAH